MKSSTPLVSEAELQALIQGWGSSRASAPGVDKFFALRFWYLCLIASFYAVWLLFNSYQVAESLSSQPAEIARIGRFLYFRGWFLIAVLWLGAFSYVKNWYPLLIWGGMFLVGSINLVFDLFNVYAEVLANPPARVTVSLMARVLGLWCIFLSIKNSSRMPDTRGRLNIFLPFRKEP